MTLTVVVLYVLLVLGIGVASRSRLLQSREDFFVASRSIGPVVLLLSLFGTHMTAFSLLGASGEAYRRGVGVFALMASSSALIVPAVFLGVGVPLWRLGRRHGFVTQTELFEARWGSRTVGRLLLVLLIVFLLPYLLIGIKGAGITLSQITDGAIPEWAGSLALCAVVLVYVGLGGVRGTAWANAFQTTVFLLLGGLAAVLIVRESGGLAAIFDTVNEQRPELLVRGSIISPSEMMSYMLIPLSVGMFPHIFMHWLTARSGAAFRLPVVAYPLCVAAVWLPSVLLGVAGAAQIPGLEGPAAGSVLIRMIELNTPAVMAGLLAAGVLAAVMSSLDSQVLALGTLISRTRGTKHDDRSPRRQVFRARLAVVGVMLVAFLLSVTVDRSLFRLGVWSFTGFAALFPLPVAALYWKRSTAAGAIACMVTVAGTWSLFLVRAWSQGHAGEMMPVALILAASTVALVGGSLLGPRVPAETVRAFFAPASEASP